MTITTRAPGKLFIAGEYAVVEPGHPSILVAVDRFITVSLTDSPDVGHVHSSEYGRLPVEWRWDAESGEIVVDHHPYDYVTSAIDMMERLRGERSIEPRPFDLHIESELDDVNGQKYGLGSSAAVVVATIAAINEFYELGLSGLDRFKIALLATIAVSPRSSGGDIASSTFGGWISYSSPDRAALLESMASSTVTECLKADGWAPLSVKQLPLPDRLRLVVGWTGSPSSTEALVGSVKKASPTDSPAYTTFLANSDRVVHGLTEALESGDPALAQGLLREARENLLLLQETSGITIETEKLKTLCKIAEQHGGAAKPSGAGGGDCGIALTANGVDVESMRGAWEEAGIRPLDLTVYEQEVAA